MPITIASVTVDCADALTVAGFWSAALDRPLTPRPRASSPASGSPGDATQRDGPCGSSRPAHLDVRQGC